MSYAIITPENAIDAKKTASTKRKRIEIQGLTLIMESSSFDTWIYTFRNNEEYKAFLDAHKMEAYLFLKRDVAQAEGGGISSFPKSMKWKRMNKLCH